MLFSIDLYHGLNVFSSKFYGLVFRGRNFAKVLRSKFMTLENRQTILIIQYTLLNINFLENSLFFFYGDWEILRHDLIVLFLWLELF